MNRGTTPAEILISTAIIIGLATAMTPVLKNFKHKGQVKQSKAKLVDLHQQISIYRSDWNQGGYSSLAEAGLPSRADVAQSALDLQESAWLSPCGKNPYAADSIRAYDYWPDAGSHDYFSYAQEAEEETILFTDFHCADHEKPLRAPLLKHRVLGIALSGRLIDRRAMGNPMSLDWWRRLDAANPK